jgi:undecaprenyl-diphosphatase
MLRACLPPYGDREAGAQRRLVLLLALATLPAVILGFAGGDFIEAHLRTLPVIATTTLVFGLLLGLAERRAPGNSGALNWAVALGVGFAQALALVPGVSRSGVTITAGVLLGLSRQEAARFSFLLSIPVIAGAGLLKTLDLLQSPQTIDWGLLGAAALVAALTAYACIRMFLALLDRVGLMPFVYYRIVLAGLLYAIWLA